MFKKENWTMKNVAFFFILICAIGVSIWGISALLLAAGAPVLVAYAGAVVFDALALWLGHEAIEVTMSGESAFTHKVITYLVVFASMYLNYLHAIQVDMVHPMPYVMTLFPLAAGFLFHFYLKRQSKKARKDQNRVVNRNPVLGFMTAVRFPFKSLRVWSASTKTNLFRAISELPEYPNVTLEGVTHKRNKKAVTEERDTLRVTATTGSPVTDLVAPVTKELVTKTVTPKPVTASATKDVTATEVVAPVTKQPMGFVAPDVTRPEWLVADPKMSNATFATLCVTNGVTDTVTATKLRELQTGQEVKAESIRMAIYRAKPKGE